MIGTSTGCCRIDSSGRVTVRPFPNDPWVVNQGSAPENGWGWLWDDFVGRKHEGPWKKIDSFPLKSRISIGLLGMFLVFRGTYSFQDFLDALASSKPGFQTVNRRFGHDNHKGSQQKHTTWQSILVTFVVLCFLVFFDFSNLENPETKITGEYSLNSTWRRPRAHWRLVPPRGGGESQRAVVVFSCFFFIPQSTGSIP